ncbi:TIGR02444 family protein [Hyphobacterium marinum]|uniref:TIGR02444 family protein n=1 Tax=Hyphobacterium marinum TaxID=3116574 RepID=A0ABU7LZD4_9PROT|nr:TIGR02444 family protein [Hyphobacterium sp. Y6023]MEE2566545.1 TIGR02444 family protein [Hyphobacterium sp. Y6023]
MTDNPFWDWSLDCYASPGVKDALLVLQDRHGLDVNLMLWCLWLAEKGREPGPALSPAIDIAQDWTRRVTGPVRSARREARKADDAADLYQGLLSCELAAERVLQDRLVEFWPHCPATSAPPELQAHSALQAYAEHCGYADGFDGLITAVFAPRETV